MDVPPNWRHRSIQGKIKKSVGDLADKLKGKSNVKK